MHEYVVEKLQNTRFRDLDLLAKHTRISKWTIQKIRLRQIRSPSVQNIETLYQYFKLREPVNPRRRAA